MDDNAKRADDSGALHDDKFLTGLDYIYSTTPEASLSNHPQKLVRCPHCTSRNPFCFWCHGAGQLTSDLCALWLSEQQRALAWSGGEL